MSDDNKYEFALDEARRGADRQNSDLARLRDRVSQLLTVGALAASFLAGLAANERENAGLWAWLGFGAFAVLLALWVAAMWPRDFIPGMDPVELVAWGDADHGRNDMMRDLALYMAENYRSNSRSVVIVTNIYRVAMVALVMEVVMLTLDVRSR